jgi:hypothetical protein
MDVYMYSYTSLVLWLFALNIRVKHDAVDVVFRHVCVS